MESPSVCIPDNLGSPAKDEVPDVAESLNYYEGDSSPMPPKSVFLKHRVLVI